MHRDHLVEPSISVQPQLQAPAGNVASESEETETANLLLEGPADPASERPQVRTPAEHRAGVPQPARIWPQLLSGLVGAVIAGAAGLAVVQYRLEPKLEALQAANAPAAAMPPAATPASAPEPTKPPDRGRQTDQPPSRAPNDAELVEQLGTRPPKSLALEEAVALSDARGRQRLAELSARQMAIDAKLGRTLLADARDPVLGRQILSKLAELPGPSSADVLYEIWRRGKRGEPATEFARALLFSREVYQKASPALRSALDLQLAESCEDYAALLPDVIAHADVRAMPVLNRLKLRWGCGPGNRQDCYRCLRRSNDLARAIVAARKRAGPRY
jgi:hypothetical protein